MESSRGWAASSDEFVESGTVFNDLGRIQTWNIHTPFLELAEFTQGIPVCLDGFLPELKQDLGDLGASFLDICIASLKQRITDPGKKSEQAITIAAHQAKPGKIHWSG